MNIFKVKVKKSLLLYKFLSSIFNQAQKVQKSNDMENEPVVNKIKELLF